MVLKLFFDIATGFRFSKISEECPLHSEAPPWLTTHAVDKKKSRGAFNQRHLQHILKVVCNHFLIPEVKTL